MTVTAILPVKSFTDAKQRLSEALSPGPRQALAQAMFSDVLVALRRCGQIDRVLVITGDLGAQQIAAGYGADVLAEAAAGDRGRAQAGHSAAAALGVAEAMRRGAARVVLLPGDVPLLDPAELDGLCSRAAAARSALIVPDRHGTGTNALLLAPPDSLTPAFGPGSCARHVELARSQGTQPEVVQVPTLALDVDTPEDLEALAQALAARHGGAAHTRGMLGQLMRSQR